jgi:hypothetical protein
MAPEETAPRRGRGPWRGRVPRIDKRYRPVLWLVLIAILGCSGLLELAVTQGPFAVVEDRVAGYLDRSETKAVEAFAAARTINAAVSVLKSTDLSAVVVQVAPMEVLEPVDDLAKQFSDVMAVSIAAILLQRLILMVSQAWALTIILPAGCALLAASVVASRRFATFSRRLAALGRSVVLLALFARFVVLAAGWAGDSITERFLAGDLNKAIATMNATGGNLDKGQALAGSAQSWVPDRSAIAAMVTGLPDQIVHAIEIFLVQTMITPCLVALFLYGVLRNLLRPMA